jgi:hypothetical protein
MPLQHPSGRGIESEMQTRSVSVRVLQARERGEGSGGEERRGEGTRQQIKKRWREKQRDKVRISSISGIQEHAQSEIHSKERDNEGDTGTHTERE